VTLLEKALKLQRERATTRCGRTSSAADSTWSRTESERAVRPPRSRGAAVEARERPRRRGCNMALDERPQDEDALAGLCEVCRPGQGIRAGKNAAQDAAALPAVEDNNEANRDARRLWERLGQLQPSVIGAALTAYEHVVENPASRRDARVALSALYGDRPEYASRRS